MHFNRGIKKYEAKDYQGALVEWDRAVALNPEYAEAYHWRGKAKGRMDDMHPGYGFGWAVVP